MRVVTDAFERLAYTLDVWQAGLVHTSSNVISRVRAIVVRADRARTAILAFIACWDMWLCYIVASWASRLLAAYIFCW